MEKLSGSHRISETAEEEFTRPKVFAVPFGLIYIYPYFRITTHILKIFFRKGLRFLHAIILCALWLRRIYIGFEPLCKKVAFGDCTFKGRLSCYSVLSSLRIYDDISCIIRKSPPAIFINIKNLQQIVDNNLNISFNVFPTLR